MSNRFAMLVMVVMSAGCGTGPDSAALVNGQGFAPEQEETGNTADALSSSAKTWLPMAEGNTWSLHSTTTNAVRSVSMQAVENGVGWVDGLSTDGAWLGVSSSAPNTLYSWNETAGWSPFIRFGYAVTPWQAGFSTGPCATFNVKRSATDVTVVTSAGVFTNARSIHFEQVGGPTVRCAAPLYRELTFAPGVGLIAMTTGNDEHFTLTAATVGAKHYPLAPAGAVTATLTADASSYVSKPNTIRCITTPCPSNEQTATAHFAYTVTNATAVSITWQFSTGCQFDLELVNEAGAVMRRLSDHRNCTFSLTSLTLAPGDSKTYSAEVDLAGTDGLQLDGLYTVRASLIPRVTSPAATGTTQVRVSLVP